MPWVAAVGSVVGAGIGANANSKAAKAQQDAANSAAALQQRQYDQTRADNLYRMQVGDNALTQLQGLTGNFTAPTAEEVMADPGYQFGLKQGQDNIQSTAAAKGGLYSGNALKALTQYGGDYATTRFNDAYNRKKAGSDTQWGRLSALAGIGQTAQTQVNSAGSNFANNTGNIGMSNANAQGAAGIANANIFGNALNQAGSAYIDYSRKNNQPVGSAFGNSGGWNDSYDSGGYGIADGGKPRGGYAEGGPVLVKGSDGRYEPKIGSRSARGNTGGGMSREAILRALNEAQDVPAKDGIAALPGDYLRNPGGVRALQLEAIEKKMEKGGMVRKDYAKGGKASGPKGRDKVPAWLTDGEHVVTKDEVTALGNGSNSKGQRKMSALRALMITGG